MGIGSDPALIASSSFLPASLAPSASGAFFTIKVWFRSAEGESERARERESERASERGGPGTRN